MLTRLILTDAMLRAEGDLQRLKRLWREELELGQAALLESSDLERLGSELLSIGAPVDAFEVSRAALKRFPSSIRLAHTGALALANLGATLSAQQIFLELLERPGAIVGEFGAELLGAIGRTHKDLSAKSLDAFERTRQQKLALEAYTRGFDRQQNLYCGINAAALLLMLGRGDAARELAARVHVLALDAQKRQTSENADSRIWLSAILGDCAFIAGNHAAAQTWYRTAHLLACSQHKLAELASTRRQVHRLAHALTVNPAEVERWLPRPQVLVFSGHRFDFLSERRPAPRLPSAWETALSDDIDAWLRGHHFMQSGELACGLSSLSVGADLIFLEALARRGCETHLVLPIDPDAYLDSTCAAHGAHFRPRLQAAIDRAASVTVASPQASSWRDRDFHLCNELIAGLALLRAESLDAQVSGLLAWDGERSASRGGTCDAWRMWSHMGIPMQRLRPRGPDDPEQFATPAPYCELGEDHGSQAICFLFADFSGFSGLADEALPQFVGEVLGGIARLLEAAAAKGTGPSVQNTWGDGVFLAFARPSHAARFALNLSDWISREQPNWRQSPLGELSARISLHAGNASPAIDPITHRPSYWGAHVSHAARLEPATPPGVIYASEPFAALLMGERISDVGTFYVGRLNWAKNVGAYPTYRVERRR